MDPETAISNPLITPKPHLPKKLIILGILILLVIILFPLYYFKIIKFKTASTPAPIAQVQSTPTQPTKYTLPCPVAKQYCAAAKQITYQGKNIGLGFTLPANTTIKAVFPGTLESGSQSGGIFKVKNHPLRWLHGKGEFDGLVATYNFFGTPVSSFAGEAVATTSAQTFPKEEPYNGVHLIFTLTKGDKFSTPVQFEFK